MDLYFGVVDVREVVWVYFLVGFLFEVEGWYILFVLEYSILEMSYMFWESYGDKYFFLKKLFFNIFFYLFGFF